MRRPYESLRCGVSTICVSKWHQEANQPSCRSHPLTQMVLTSSGGRVISRALCQRPDLLAHQLKLKSLSQEMIEKFLRVFPSLRFTSKPNTFVNGANDQLFFRRCFKDFVQRSFGCLLVDLLQPQIALQTAATDGAFAQTQAGIALRELRIVEIAILAQARDDFLDQRFGCTTTSQKVFAKLLDGTLLRR